MIIGNTQTFRKGGWPVTDERKQEIKVLKNMQGRDVYFVAGPKPPRGYTADFESLVEAHRAIIRAAASEPESIRRGAINRIQPDFVPKKPSVSNN